MSLPSPARGKGLAVSILSLSACWGTCPTWPIAVVLALLFVLCSLRIPVGRGARRT